MMHRGYFQSFAICIFLLPLLLVVRLAGRKGAGEALQEEAKGTVTFLEQRSKHTD